MSRRRPLSREVALLLLLLLLGVRANAVTPPKTASTGTGTDAIQPDHPPAPHRPFAANRPFGGRGTGNRTVEAAVRAEPTVAGTAPHKPVFLMHGINDSEREFSKLESYIEKYHPNTVVVPIPLYDNDPKSFAPLWTQAKGIKAFIEGKVAGNNTFSGGYHLLCHSQGALTCRAVVETFDDHKIDTFISLAGPQLGEYGAYGDFMKRWFPEYTVPNVWRLVYNSLMQSMLSVANFWNDPHQREKYLEHNTFLPVLNNEISGKEKEQYKKNMLALKRAVFFGSSSDQEIIPWQSAIFGFYDNAENIVSMKNSELYKDDTFGLRTLDEQKRLVVQGVDGVSHSAWVRNEDVFKEHIMPHLT